MRKVYHWEPNGANAQLLITLAEKGLAYESIFLDVLAGENHQPALTALNPGGELPVLVDNGHVFTQASYICEYLEEAYPKNPLMPVDAHGRWVVRGWLKYVDDYYASAMSDLAWEAGRAKVDPAALTAGAQSAPTPERQQVWREHRDPFPSDRLDMARDYVARGVQKLDDALENAPWLAGSTFGLADIALYAWTGYLPWAAPGAVTSNIAEWLERVGARDSVQLALQSGRADNAFAIAAPGPEHTRWG